MEAKLMVGDWVDWNGHYMQVEGTAVGGDTYFGIDAVCDIIPNAELSPIPLTECMLKDNGLYERCEFFDGWNFEFADNKKRVVSVSGIWFVHEIQHVLRICGLSGLADEFRVE